MNENNEQLNWIKKNSGIFRASYFFFKLSNNDNVTSVILFVFCFRKKVNFCNHCF